MRNYYLFIDESGDHGLNNLDPNFPVFLLCGILISHDNYIVFDDDIKKLKRKIWGSDRIVLHSRNIRKCENDFSVLFNIDIKKSFLSSLNKIITESNYCIIASAIDKHKYINNYGKLSNDVYELSLSFIIERAIFYLDDLKDNDIKLTIIIENRGKKEDKNLDEHFQRLLSRGTGYVSRNRLLEYSLKIIFKKKKDNINGLQLSDLIAYPIARYVIDNQSVNLAYDLIRTKIYSKRGNLYGLKIFP